eukprot:Nitzschia sp. Nitz4//scaffold47_size129522//67235//74024//NITZ4_003555-RA/size129522-augustus-gene-0.109-mRNA-1//1//CDS//3329552812//4104//frame0
MDESTEDIPPVEEEEEVSVEEEPEESEAIVQVLPDDEEDADDDDEPASVADEVDEDDDDDDEEVIAVQVVEEDDEDDVDVDDEEDDPPILPSTPKNNAKDNDTPSKPASTGKKKPAPAAAVKKSKRRKSRRSVGDDATGISGDRLAAANTAREILVATVPRLPVPVNDSYTVRAFGRLHIEQASMDYSTPNALCPVGFSCDRYEFSPVHGRVLKLRCSILDGAKTNLGQTGPVFRVMWGQGVDEDVEKVEYPYNPYSNSAPISGNDDDVVALPADHAAAKKDWTQYAPTVGMRVKVRFDQDQFYYGTIIDADENGAGGGDDDTDDGKSKSAVDIVIRYDDGSTEDAFFPDPDISLVMPGNEMDADGNVELTELHGKPVTCTVGRTPLEAWSNCLIQLGMVDEIIVEQAMAAVKATREDPTSDSKSAKADVKKPRKSQAASEDGMDQDGDTNTAATNDNEEAQEEAPPEEEDAESVSPEEQELLGKVEALRKEMAEAKEVDDAAAVELADARIAMLGSLMCNPFVVSDGGKGHQASWMAVAVRREKAKMGSTGNKRKVVTATDLLERNNTFFNHEVEALVEGLPGSEYCTQYHYHANRGSHSASRQWLQEQKLIQERENKKRHKMSKVAKVKATQIKEKELKRKKREDERDARKRMRLEEEEEKKKARIEERLSRLRVQVEDRLFKEATFQREKVVLLLAKNLAKEFARRRKAAELLAGQAIDTGSDVVSKRIDDDLPPLSKKYDEEIVKIWDFVTTFGDFFLSREYMTSLPPLDTLQMAIDTLRDRKTDMNKAEALAFVTELAVSLCQPLSADLTRTIFASLIALNPALQKDFGAAFFNEVNAATPKEDSEKNFRSEVLLPVNGMTWKEIARMALVSDALGELGYTRQDTAHLLRGYRSAGHPNSKEARRLRRVEDFSISLLRQNLTESVEVPEFSRPGNSVHLLLPSTPSVDSTHWSFFLHNAIVSSPLVDIKVMTENVSKALELAKSTDGTPKETLSALKETLADLEQGHDSHRSSRAKRAITRILEETTSEHYSTKSGDTAETKEEYEFDDQGALVALRKLEQSAANRARIGVLSHLVLTRKNFKELTKVREEYMSDALQLKEEMKRQEMKEAGEDDDDDEDDDEDDEQDAASKADTSMAAEAVPETKSDSKDAEMTETTEATPASNGTAEAKDNDSSEDPVQPVSGFRKETQYDEFCGDIPTAPELIRRCLAVLRTLSQTGPAEPFIYPVDPQTNPGYYDMLIQPMCMREVGTRLQKAAKAYESCTPEEQESFVENTVFEFARDVRLIGSNCLSYANAGPTIISAGGEMLRIFERLLLDWVLAPPEYARPLESLDDDLCVDPHPSDVEATVLLCDGCEGNYNISRLDPPLLDIPKGDWHCPGCLSGRWWGDLDPRIGKKVSLKDFGGASGSISKCSFCHTEAKGSASLMYEVALDDGSKEFATLETIDSALDEAGTPVPKIHCLAAVAESKGYGYGVDHGLRMDLIPVPLNPKVSDAASQVALSSSVFRDSIAAASALLVCDPREMTAGEWLRLLSLLIMKCSSSDVMQNVAAEMENEAAERLAKRLEEVSKISTITDVIPELTPETQDEPVLQEVKSDPVASGAVAEAGAVEVVECMEVDGVPSQSDVVHVEAEARVSLEDEMKVKYDEALGDKTQRQKAREDGIAAFCIKNQLKSTIASFEQDNVSSVVDSTLATKEEGLSFPSTRCRGAVCDFCGLSDTALGTNLVRIPNAQEWDELVKLHFCSRKTQLVADLGEHGRKKSSGRTLMKVSVRIDDDLVGVSTSKVENEKSVDGGMMEFLPRNPDGFQDELLFRYNSGLPFVSGSLTGHECCGVAAHNARRVKVVQDYKERQAILAEMQEGNTCGRTLEMGRDELGRSYWIFNTDPGSLFVCEERTEGVGKKNAKWHKYSEPEDIASVMVSLGKNSMVQDLKKAFPKSWKMVGDRSWVEAIMKRHYKLEKTDDEPDEDTSMADGIGEDNLDIGHESGTKVLVESVQKNRYWDGEIRAVAKNVEGKITGYRVHYSAWNTRFDEWVSASRILEPTPENTATQMDLLKSSAALKYGLPISLEYLEAVAFLDAKDRARGNRPLPDFAKIAFAPATATDDERTFVHMKAALLAIEAALPLGSINHLDRGDWRPAFAHKWSNMVKDAEGPWGLMRCVIVLEDTILEEWTKEQIGHLRACLPSRWKALDEACVASVALRITLLDRGLLYGTVDRRRFRQTKSKK